MLHFDLRHPQLLNYQMNHLFQMFLSFLSYLHYLLYLKNLKILRYRLNLSYRLYLK
jgi:hypothetical protein